MKSKGNRRADSNNHQLNRSKMIGSNLKSRWDRFKNSYIEEPIAGSREPDAGDELAGLESISSAIPGSVLDEYDRLDDETLNSDDTEANVETSSTNSFHAESPGLFNEHLSMISHSPFEPEVQVDRNIAVMTQNLFQQLGAYLDDGSSSTRIDDSGADKLKNVLENILKTAIYHPAALRPYTPQLIELLKQRSSNWENPNRWYHSHNYAIRILGILANTDLRYVRKALPCLFRSFFDFVGKNKSVLLRDNLGLLSSFMNHIVFSCALSNPGYILPTILEYTSSNNEIVKRLSNDYINELIKIPQKVLASLIACLMRSDEVIRCNAVSVLGRLGRNDDFEINAIVPYLLNSINDPSPNVRIQAKAALTDLNIDIDNYQTAVKALREVRETIYDLKNLGCDIGTKEKVIHNLYNLMNTGNFDRVIVISNLNNAELVQYRSNYIESTENRLALRPITRQFEDIYEQDSGLRFDLNFDQFMVKPDNYFAHSAAYAVATKPSRVFNPLFIYGAYTTGKTHLLNAIGNFALLENPSLSVTYYPAEGFIDGLKSALANDEVSKFRQTNISSNILLIDDIQKFQGDYKAQSELLFAMNELYHKNGQIVISSDRSPSGFSDMDERLVNRFAMGVVTSIIG